MAFIKTAGSMLMSGASLYGSVESARAANRAAANQERLINLQSKMAEEQLEFAKQQWETYKTKIMPLEIEAAQLGISAQELALRRGEDDYNLYRDYYMPLQKELVDFQRDILGDRQKMREAYLPLEEEMVADARRGVERIKPQYERVATEAAAAVDSSFERERAILRRDLERRGVRPDEGGYFGRDRTAGLAQAAARAQAMNRARWNERDRVEGQNLQRDQLNLNMKLAALGRRPTAPIPAAPGAPAPTQSTNVPGLNPSSIASMFSGATGAMGSAGQNAGSLANMYANNAAGGMQAAINLGKSAMDFYNQYASNPTLNTTGNTSYSPNFASSNPWANPAVGGPRQFYDGGPVHAPALRRDDGGGGMVRGPGGIDNVPAVIQAPDGTTYDAVLTDGEYVIPKDVVMAKGGDAYFDKFVEDVRKKKQIGGRRKALSRGGM